MARFEQISLDMIGRLLVAVELAIWAGEQGLGVLRPGDWLLCERLINCEYENHDGEHETIHETVPWMDDEVLEVPSDCHQIACAGCGSQGSRSLLVLSRRQPDKVTGIWRNREGFGLPFLFDINAESR
jgi:hypothetical protein